MHPLAIVALGAWLVLVAGGIAFAIVLGSRSDGDDDGAAVPAPTRAHASEAFVRGNILGLRCSTASRFLRDRYGLDDRSGCVILRVDARSGAEHAGLLIGDNIIEVNSVPITSGRQFSHVFERQGSSRVQLRIERERETMTVDVALGRYADAPDDDPYYDYLIARGNPDAATAIEYFSRQLMDDPGFDLAHAYRAEYLIDEAGGVEDLSLSHAESDLQEALRIDPELAEAHEIYARLLSSRLERHDDALAEIEQAIELSGCTPPIASHDVDCGEILMSRAEIYLRRNAPGDVALIRQDVGTVATVEAVTRRAAGIASQADSNELEERRGAGRCTNEWEIVIPCALYIADGDWTPAALAEQEASTRLIMSNIAGERMQETRFWLAQLIANQGGDLGEAIDQLTLAMEDAYCERGIDPAQCGKYVFARAQTYYVRNAPGDAERAVADFRVAADVEGYHDEATRSLEFIASGR